jgi:hypothetical protein
MTTLTKTDKGVFVTGPVQLEGYQAILAKSKFGYSLSALFPESWEDQLEDDRELSLKWAESRLKNPKRSVLKPTPWESTDAHPGFLKVKMSWNDENRPQVVDTDNVPVDDPGIPLYSGAVVRLIFKQKPYILKDGETFGTSLKCQGVQIISLKNSAGTDSGDLTEEDIANLFTVDQAHGLDAEEAEFSRKAALETDEDSDF